jgi:hypothetical protein
MIRRHLPTSILLPSKIWVRKLVIGKRFRVVAFFQSLSWTSGIFDPFGKFFLFIVTFLVLAGMVFGQG